MSSSLIEDCIASNNATIALSNMGYPDIQSVMRTALIGTLLHSGTTGCCAMLVYTYFFVQPKRDPLLARLGIMGLMGLCLTLCGVWLYQNDRMLAWSTRFTADHLRDYWLLQFENLIFTVMQFPIMLFFCNRAYCIWDRNRWVLGVCLIMSVAAFAMGLAAASKGLIAPWGFSDLTNEQDQYYMQTYQKDFTAYFPLWISSTAISLAALCTISTCITAGIFRHRSGFTELDSAISKILFVCTESLAPMMVVQTVSLVAQLFKAPWAILILRSLAAVGTPVFFYCLMLSLICRQRVSDILKANPIRNAANFTQPLTDLEKLNPQELNCAVLDTLPNMESSIPDNTKSRSREISVTTTTNYGISSSPAYHESTRLSMDQTLGVYLPDSGYPSPGSQVLVQPPTAAITQRRRAPTTAGESWYNSAGTLGFGRSREVSDPGNPYVHYSTGHVSLDHGRIQRQISFDALREDNRRASDSLGLFDVLARGPENC